MTNKVMKYLFHNDWDSTSLAAKWWDRWVKKNIRKLNKLSVSERRKMVREMI